MALKLNICRERPSHPNVGCSDKYNIIIDYIWRPISDPNIGCSGKYKIIINYIWRPISDPNVGCSDKYNIYNVPAYNTLYMAAHL